MFKESQLKEYLISSGITFITAFLLAVLPLIQVAPVEEVLSKGFLIGLLGAGFRAGIKATVEFLTPKVQSLFKSLQSWMNR